MDDDICELVIIAPDAEWLAGFTRRLVEERLCASGARRGAVSLVPEIIRATTEEHPYEVPCVVAPPILGGNPAYINWVLAETTVHHLA